MIGWLIISKTNTLKFIDLNFTVIYIYRYIGMSGVELKIFVSKKKIYNRKLVIKFSQFHLKNITVDYMVL